MSRLLPIFPLPNLILYPGSLVPLHLFEPRYLRMMEDMLATDQSDLVAGTLLPGWEDAYFENPDLHPVAGLGRLQHVAKDSAGNFNLVLRGIQRVRIVSEPGRGDQSSPYRKVLIEELEEPILQRDDAPAESQALLLALESLSGSSVTHAAGQSVNYLADVLLVQLPLDMRHKLDLFSLCDARARAQAVIKAWEDLHNGTLPPPAESGPGFHPDRN